jgi:hypothetical protein
MAGPKDYLRSLLGLDTEDSRAEDAARDSATALWEEQLANNPDGYSLGGFGLFGATPGQLESNPLYGLQANRNSQLAGVQSDPRMAQAQMGALSQLEEIGAQGGYTDAERAQMGNMQRDAGNIARSRRLAAQSQAEARGMGRGGASLMGALQAGQGGANAASAAANQTAIAAQQRALGAIESAGQLSGQIRGQGFNEASQGASAADAWNRGTSNLIMQRQGQLAQGQQQSTQNQQQNVAGATNQYNVNASAEQDDQDAIQARINAAMGSFGGGGS